MSYAVEGNKITMTRGDTLVVNVSILSPFGYPYEPEEGDTVRFAVKRSDMNNRKTKFKDETPLILKEIPTDTLQLRLDPEDTKSLGFGSNYVYDIQLTHADGVVDTFITNAPFVLSPEVD